MYLDGIWEDGGVGGSKVKGNAFGKREGQHLCFIKLSIDDAHAKNV